MPDQSGSFLKQLHVARRLSHWFAVAVTLVLFGLVTAALVDLKPHEIFFFASSDPKFQESKKIDQTFPSGDQLIVSVTSPDISSSQYLDRLEQLTEKLKSIESVTGVRSLTDRPKDFEDAEKSPFWRRLLIAENHKSSNLVAFVHAKDSERIIPRIEAIAANMGEKIFKSALPARRTLSRCFDAALRMTFATSRLLPCCCSGWRCGWFSGRAGF
jgi:uncharacterized protein